MPAWVTPVLALITLIFGAGSSWAILSYRQGKSELSQVQVVKDLKECVTKLQGVVTEVEVMKVAQARFDRQSEATDKRLTALEIAVGNLQPRRIKR